MLIFWKFLLYLHTFSLTSQDTLEKWRICFLVSMLVSLKLMPREHDQWLHRLAISPYLGIGSHGANSCLAQEHEMTSALRRVVSRYDSGLQKVEPGMWTSILLSNHETILDRIEDFKERLNGGWTSHHQRGDEGANLELFQSSAWATAAMEIHKQGGVDSSYDLYVDVPRWRRCYLGIWRLLRRGLL